MLHSKQAQTVGLEDGVFLVRQKISVWYIWGIGILGNTSDLHSEVIGSNPISSTKFIAGWRSGNSSGSYPEDRRFESVSCNQSISLVSMAAQRSPTPLVRVRILGGMPYIKFAGDSPSWSRHRILIPTCVGSNPTSPASHKKSYLGSLFALPIQDQKLRE